MTHAPSPEVRIASGPAFHQVAHSIGLVVTDVDTANGAYSWAVHRAHPGLLGNLSARDREAVLAQPPGDAVLVELGGWGLAGPIPPVDELSGPPSLLAVHTVWLEKADAEHLSVLRQLIDEHAARFGECRVFVAHGASLELAAWVAGGCVGNVAPSDEDLAAANTDTPTPPDRPRVERSGYGWAEDGTPPEPVADEVSSEAANPAEVAWQEELANVAADKLARNRATERSEPLPEGVTRQQLRHQRTGAPGRPA
jgi:hypothetical protein